MTRKFAFVITALLSLGLIPMVAAHPQQGPMTQNQTANYSMQHQPDYQHMHEQQQMSQMMYQMNQMQQAMQNMQYMMLQMHQQGMMNQSGTGQGMQGGMNGMMTR